MECLLLRPRVTAFAEYTPARGASVSGPVPPIPNNLTYLDLAGSIVGEA